MIIPILITALIAIGVFAATRPTIMVLKYHHVNPLPESNLSYKPESFERQIKELLDRGYTCITLDEMYQQLYKKRKSSRKQFVLTFDDGFVDNYLYAYPILQKYNIPATIFLTTSNIVDSDLERSCDSALMVGNDQAFLNALKNRYDSFLNWSEITQMHKSGLVDFEPHGHYHKYIYISKKIEYYTIGETLCNSFKLRSLEDPNIKIGSDVHNSGPSLGYPKYDPHTKVKETDWQAYKRYVDEIGDSKHIIEKRLDKQCYHFAWPWGKFSHLSLQAAKYLGMHTICTSFPGANSVFTNHCYIKRFNPAIDPLVFARQIKKYSNSITAMFHR